MQETENKKLLYNLLFLILAMILLSYAAVPLYSIFCKATGFGGTPAIASSHSSLVVDRKMRVNFDANTDKDLPWRFSPDQKNIDLKLGENVLVFYTAENSSQEPIIGTATYNIIPDEAGAYFNKIECFCFQEQLLQPGEKASMPVSFFIDPEILNDPIVKSLESITLSYSFFRSR